jgi:hypothetical protein
MQNQIETGIPFCGFYCSIYDSEFDSAAQNLAEYLADEIGASVEAIAEELWSIAQWESARDKVSRLHIEVFLEKFSDLVGVDILAGQAQNITTFPRIEYLPALTLKPCNKYLTPCNMPLLKP